VKQQVMIKADRLEILDKVLFETNRDVIKSQSYALLNNVGFVLSKHPEIPVIRVEGHTDDQGDDAHNLDLSNRRAMAVVKYLIAQGIGAERLIPAGFGETQPIQPNKTPTGRAANRRVEFRIVRQGE